ncbi:uncharacterized protein C2845_PM01G49490 [Panicum miliaceum]|uniref:La-related protein 1C-like n=1 Tax=Panicum miliaceum TaxID=4540 RepID=A0A3L6TJJ7_PANMI|nr:uncharacterized protein C2845_PM01G49490 [Panicum miliaceum]
MEPPASSSSSPDLTPPDQPSPSPAKRSAWKHPAPNGPAVMDANHWPALSEAAKNTTKLAPSPDSSRPPESSPAPVAASSATPNSSNSHKHSSGTHHGRHKPARRGAAAGEHSPRDHPDRSTGGWDHATGAAGGRGAQRNHNNGGARRGNGTAAAAAAAAGSGGGFANRRRGGYEPFYRGPPPMGMGPYMRGAPPPPPPMTVPPPFMGPPPTPVSPMRPFAGPMVFHDMQSPVSPVSPIYFYGPPPPPEALRGLALAPPMVQELTKDLQYIKEIVQSSSILEMQGAKIRKQNDWEKWVIPRESNPDIPSSSASVARRNVNNLTANLGGMGLHESASSSSRVEQNHHDVIQNGSPSGNDEAPVAEDNSGHHQQLLE